MSSTASFLWRLFLDALRIVSSRKKLFQLLRIRLYSNALFLAANAGANSALGLVFWVLAARFLSVEDVGVGSALVSAAALLSFGSSLGLGYAMVRFLPTAGGRAQLLINSTLTLTGLISLAVGAVFILGMDWWAPTLRLVLNDPLDFMLFIALVTAGTANIIMRQIFVAFRRAGFALATGLIYGVTRAVLIAVIVITAANLGVLFCWAAAMVTTVVVGLLLLLRQLSPGYRPQVSLGERISSGMMRFSLASHLGDGVWFVPGWVLPLAVVHLLGAQAGAYFYTSWAMTGLLVNIPRAVALSLLAEGSRRQAALSRHVLRSLKLNAMLLIPAVAVFFLLGDRMLLVFGEAYSTAGVHLLWILAASALPASLNQIYLGVARVQRNQKSVIAVSSAIMIGTVGLGYGLMPTVGIIGVGIAWLASHTVVAVAIMPKLIRLTKASDEEGPDAQANDNRELHDAHNNPLATGNHPSMHS